MKSFSITKVNVIERTHNRIEAMLNGRAIGYLTYKYPDDSAGKRNVEVKFLFVSKPYRRNGIATKLLKYFISKFSKVTWISLWTWDEVEKQKSYGLYRKLGFEQLAYQKDYYKKGIGTRLFGMKMKR